MFRGSTLLISGGTGSFGSAALKRFLQTDIGEIRVFSRDEKKQDEQRSKFPDSRLRFYIGDVRDLRSVQRAMVGVDFVFHAAALKQVPSCEFFPMEAVKTNVFGTENVLEAALSAGVRRVVCLSTDKAVHPVNAMGMTKALMEKVVIARSSEMGESGTVVCATRYGNVMGSRGSVIPRFIRQVQQGEPMSITNPAMTRFMMSIDDAINLVLFAFSKARGGEIYVNKAPAATIEVLSGALAGVLRRDNYPIRTIGVRHGEKMFESLVSQEEMVSCEDLGDFFCIHPDQRDLNYERYVVTGNTDLGSRLEYSSENCRRLDIDEMKKLLLGLDVVRSYLSTDQLEVSD